MRRSSGKQRPQQLQYDQTQADCNQLEEYSPEYQQLQIIDSGFSECLENRLENMQPNSVNVNDELENVDLTTENLPAVDTPDACDKAAIR